MIEIEKQKDKLRNIKKRAKGKKKKIEIEEQIDIEHHQMRFNLGIYDDMNPRSCNSKCVNIKRGNRVEHNMYTVQYTPHLEAVTQDQGYQDIQFLILKRIIFIKQNKSKSKKDPIFC